MIESAKKSLTVKRPFQIFRQDLTHKMMRELETLMICKEISDREKAISDLQARSDSQNDERIGDINDLKTKMLQENAFLKSLNGKTLGVYFNAYRTKAYNGGGEENLTF